MSKSRNLAMLESLEARTMLSAAGGVSSSNKKVVPPPAMVVAIKRPVKRNVTPPSAGAIPAVPVAPVILSLSAAGRSHSATLNWTNVSNETGYTIERSTDGLNWVIAGNTSVNITTFVDTSLLESTRYQFRVKATNLQGSSAPSAVSAVTTNAFRALDGTGFQGRPEPLAANIERAHLAYASIIDSFGQPIESKVREEARAAFDAGQILVFDIEQWPVDIRALPIAKVNDNLRRYQQIIDWARNERPNIKIGLYGELPLAGEFNPDNPAHVATWKNANDFVNQKLAPSVDFVMPSLYSIDAEPGDWLKFAKLFLDESRKFGKPVYPFINPYFDPSMPVLGGSFIPADYWQLILGTIRSSADGMMLWTGPGVNWNPTAPWWIGTQQFLAESAALPATPTVLTITASGAILNWTDNANNESGFEIERSTDGINYKLVSAVGSNTTTWSDSDIFSGATYSYRVRAFNAYGFSNYISGSSVVGRRALVKNQGENFEGGAGVFTNHNAVIGMDNGDYIVYQQVDFAGGANQFLAEVSTPPAAAGQKIEIRLDSLSGPVIGILTVGATRDYGYFMPQTTAVTSVTGIHDLYLIGRPSSDGTRTVGTATIDSFQFRLNQPPAGPNNLVANSFGNRVELVWQENSGDETQFIIERSIDGINFIQHATVGANVTTYTDMALVNGVKYQYRIRAANAFGISAPSNVDAGAKTTRNPYTVLQTETADTFDGPYYISTYAVGVGQTSAIGFLAMDFGAGATSVFVRLASPEGAEGGRFDFRLDDANGPVIGTLTMQTTNSYGLFQVQSALITGASGIHDIYITGRDPNSVANLDWISFSQ